MKDTMILNDGSVVNLEDASSLSAIRVLASGQNEMLDTWQKLTDENLKEVQVKNAGGVTVGRYADLVLVSETSVLNPDGSVLTSYNMREKTDVEKRLENLEIGQEVQDGAISDLGEAVSGLVEEGGLA